MRPPHLRKMGLILLARKIFGGALWVVGSGLVARVVGLFGTLAITRFLSPEQMGEVGVAVILTTTATELSNLGFGQYVIANVKREARAFHVTMFNLVTAAVALVITWALAGTLGVAFDAPAMVRFIPGMALAMFFHRLSLVPESIVLRDLRFRVFSVGAGTTDLMFTVTSLGLATLGFGGGAIVIGNLVQHGARLLYFAVAAGWRAWLQPEKLRVSEAREILRFGLPLAVSNISGFAAVKWDNMIMSRAFGPGVMGTYGLAYNLATIPADHVGTATSDVLMPSFASMPDGQVQRAFVRSIKLLALVVFPLATGLGAISGTLVVALFRAEWQGVAPFLLILGMLSLASPIGDAIHVYLCARRRTRAAMVLSLFGTALLLSLVALGAQVSPEWAAVGAGLGGWCHAAAGLALAQRLDALPAREALRQLVPPALASAVMVGVVFGVRATLTALGGLPSVALLGVEVLAGALAYVIAVFALAPGASRELLGHLRSALRRRAKGAEQG